MHILKFGGTSMVDEESWRRVLEIISRYDKPVVVVSATARTTRQLVTAAEAAVTDFSKAEDISSAIYDRHKKIVENFLEHSNREQKDYLITRCRQWLDEFYAIIHGQLTEIYDEQKVTAQRKDLIMSWGEKLSSSLFSVCGLAEDFPMKWIDAGSVIKTDLNYGSAQPDVERIQSKILQLSEKVDEGYIPVIGGFYGQDEKGITTTLGFEGSDYSAALIGAALNAEAIEIWTDVSGIFTCDPRVLPSAKPINQLSFSDAEQLANHGAKVLHPSTMKPASSASIPVFVKNIFDTEAKGTKIVEKAAINSPAAAIAYIEDVVVLKINTANQNRREHRLVEVFAVLDEYEASITAVKTTKKITTVILTNTDQAEALEGRLSAISTVSKWDDKGLIGLVGYNMSDEEKLNKLVEQTLSTSPSSLTFNKQKKVLNIVMESKRVVDGVKQLHKAFFE